MQIVFLVIIAIVFYIIIGLAVIENKKTTNTNQITISDKPDHTCPEYSIRVKSSGVQSTKVKSFQLELVETSPIPEELLHSLHEEETKNDKF